MDWNQKVIVRSSSLSEDTSENSQAGKYESIADVAGEAAFVQAVEKVIASYDDDNDANQILVQPMLSQVSICGVAFTLDPNTMGNYYVINYDAGGSTSAITSGQGAKNKLYYRFKADVQEKNRRGGVKMQSESMNRLCLAVSLYREIITDSVWAYQRDNYGYRNLRSFPLMVDFAGLPYIDVRVSFNSFIQVRYGLV